MNSNTPKFIVLVADGMTDYPLAELTDRTPLAVARTPNIDYLAKHGKIGLTFNVPKGMTPGSDIANLSIFGYDPHKYFTGRAPLEAVNLGVDLQKNEVAFRCNLISVEKDILVDYSAGHISTKEAQVLINFLNQKIGDKQIRFYAGVNYRHLMVIKSPEHQAELLKLRCFPPHDIMGKPFIEYLPRGRSNEKVIELMKKSQSILSRHDVNQVRIDLKENPANMIWLWGQGEKIELPTFKEKYGLKGSVISAVDLINGIGRSIGLTPIDVPGATGYYDTNYEGKADYALQSLKKNDFVFVHVEAPDEAGHNGDTRQKILAIENFDRYIVGKILRAYKNDQNARIIVLPDHPTPIALKTHTADPVCFLMYGKGIEKDEIDTYSEDSAKNSNFKFEDGYNLMDCFIKEENI